jgi:hypothetical protein
MTIAELMAGKKPHMPWIDPTSFKKAVKENTTTQDKLF